MLRASRRLTYYDVLAFLRESISEDFRVTSEPEETPPKEIPFVSEKPEEAMSKDIEPPPKAKRPVLYLPVDDLTEICDSAEDCFKGMAATGEYFFRDGVFVKPTEVDYEGIMLDTIDANQFPSELEYVFEVRKKYYAEDEKTGKRCVLSKRVNCKPPDANLILNTKGKLRKHSLPLRLLSVSPVIIERNCEPVVLPKGYHGDAGGIYIINGLEIPTMSLDEAVEQLTNQLFADYDFTNEVDYSRAIAHVISPAMKLGNLLGDADFPLDVGLGDQSQSGKTHRMKFTAMVYGEKAYSLAVTTRGTGGLDETIATALLSGKLFILIDNVRGEFNSQILETILRGSGSVAARVPYRKAVLSRTNRSCWQLTSNMASFTPDLANRSVVVSNQKRARGYEQQAKLPWGDLFYEHVKANQPKYLGAVHTVVDDWIRRGKPRTTESRHSFTAWVQSMDWIVQNTFHKPPLMQNHQQTQRVLTDPDHAWLRQIVLLLVQSGATLPKAIQAHDMRELGELSSLQIPGLHRKDANEDTQNQVIGKVMSRIFKQADSEEVGIDAYTVKRIKTLLPLAKHSKTEYIVIPPNPP